MAATESVYNLIPKDVVYQEKAPMHQSTHKARVRASAEATKSPGKLFGPPGGSRPDPKNFTKKGAGVTKRPAVKADNTKRMSQTVLAPGTERRPTPSKYVSRHTDKANLAPRTKKNFLKDNLKTATFKSTVRKTADTQRIKGTGKVPAYLTKRKTELKEEQQMQATLEAEAAANTGLSLMPDEERESLLSGLKQNYKDLQKAYQGLSVIVDTIPKKERKQSMEAKLSDLERDIALLERHTEIYVRT